MGIITVRSKETKKLLGEYEVSEDVIKILKKQENPSQFFENVIKEWIKKEGDKP